MSGLGQRVTAPPNPPTPHPRAMSSCCTTRKRRSFGGFIDGKISTIPVHTSKNKRRPDAGTPGTPNIHRTLASSYAGEKTSFAQQVLRGRSINTGATPPQAHSLDTLPPWEPNTIDKAAPRLPRNAISEIKSREAISCFQSGLPRNASPEKYKYQYSRKY